MKSGGGSEEKDWASFIRKTLAVGWALREITKKDPIAVFEFLKKWAKEEDKVGYHGRGEETNKRAAR